MFMVKVLQSKKKIIGRYIFFVNPLPIRYY